MYDIIIIGSGPAGMSAALYALRAGKKVLILEKKMYGGQIIETPNIENYPGIENISGYDFATNLYNQVKNLNAEIKYEEVIEISKEKEVITNKNKYKSKSIIIATGQDKKKLGINNEENLLGKGISYCATCDGPFFKEKDVAVVGGGNTALEDALYLSNICKKVYLIHRRDKFRGEEKLQKELDKHSNIELILNSNVEKINGNEKLNSIIVNEKEIKLDALFIAIGGKPNNDFVKEILKIDNNGYIETRDGVHTNIDKIYVAGDIRNSNLKQLITATADGAQAATTAIEEMED